MPIDEALKQRLIAAGKTDTLTNLQNFDSKTGIINIVKNTANQFFNPTSESQAKVVAPVAKFVAPLGESLGTIASLPYIQNLQKESLANQAALSKEVLIKIKDKTIPVEQRQKVLQSYLKTDPQLITHNNEILKSTKEIFGEGATTALNTAALLSMAGGLTTGSVLTKPTQAILNASKYVETLGKAQTISVPGQAATAKIVPSLGPTIAGAFLRGSTRALEGGLFGTAIGMQEGKTTKDIEKEAAVLGAVSLLAPPILGSAFKATSKTVGLYAKAANKFVEDTIPYLKNIAEKVPNGTGNWLIDTASSRDASLPRTIAAGASKVAEFATKELNTTLTDRLAPIAKFAKKAEDVLRRPIVNTPTDAYIQARNYAGIEGKFKVAEHDFKQIFDKQYGDIKDETMGYIKGLDLLNRAERGMRVEGNKGIDEIKQMLVDTELRVGEQNLPRLKEAVQKYNEFTVKNILGEFVDSGITSKDAADKMLKANPNWTPHDVLDYFENQAATSFVGPGSTKSFSVSQSPIKAAEGSLRDVAPVEDATMHRLQQAQIVSARNRVANSILDPISENPEAFGAVPIRTEPMVQKRYELLDKLTEKIREGKKAIKQLQSESKYGKQETEQLTKMQEDLIAQEIELNQTLTRFMNEDPEVVSHYQGSMQVTKIPNEMRQLADSVAKYKTFEEFLASPESIQVEKMSLNGDLERAGISRRTSEQEIKSFYDAAVQGEITPSIDKTITKEAQVSTGELSKGAKQVSKTKENIGIQQTKVESADDAVKNAQRIVDEIKAEKTAIREELKTTAEKDIESVDYLKQGLDKVSRFKNGVREDWLVPQDLASAMKNLDGYQAGTIMRWLKIPANILRAGATRLNIAFSISNLPRDVQTAAGVGKYGFSPEQLRVALNDITNLDLPVVREFYQLGGSGAGVVGAEKPTRDILAASNRAPIFNLPMKVADIVGGVAERFENATRLAVYRNALERGATKEMAIFEARNATVDFAKYGNLIGTLNQVIPFLNARVQGTVNILSAIDRDPTQFVRRQLLQSVFPTMLLYAHNNQFASFKNIPKFDKDNNWIFVYGEHQGLDNQGNAMLIPDYFKIRKSEVQQVAANTTEQYLDTANNNFPRETSKFLQDQILYTSPVNTGSLGPLTTPVELASNYDLYFQQPIEPDYQQIVEGGKKFSRADVPVELRAQKWNGATAKMLSEKLGKNVGMSPARIEFIIGKIFGTAGKDILTAVDMTQTGLDRTGIPDKKASPTQILSRVPIFRTFIGSNSNAELINLYDIADKVTKGTVQNTEIPKELQAEAIYRTLKEVNTKLGPDVANAQFKALKLDKDMASRVKRIGKNAQTGGSIYGSVYSGLTNNRDKVNFLIQVLNEIPAKEQKNKLIEDLRKEKLLSPEVIKQLRMAAKAKVLKAPTQ